MWNRARTELSGATFNKRNHFFFCCEVLHRCFGWITAFVRCTVHVLNIRGHGTHRHTNTQYVTYKAIILTLTNTKQTDWNQTLKRGPGKQLLVFITCTTTALITIGRILCEVLMANWTFKYIISKLYYNIITLYHKIMWHKFSDSDVFS